MLALLQATRFVVLCEGSGKEYSRTLPGEGGEARRMGLWWACCHLGLKTSSCHPQMKTIVGGVSDLCHDQTEVCICSSTHFSQPAVGFRSLSRPRPEGSLPPWSSVRNSGCSHSSRSPRLCLASLQSTLIIFCPPVWTTELSKAHCPSGVDTHPSLHFC